MPTAIFVAGKTKQHIKSQYNLFNIQQLTNNREIEKYGVHSLIKNKQVCVQYKNYLITITIL